MAYSSTRGKRELNLMQLMPPDYEISPQLLLDGYMEKEVKFLGTIPGVPIDLDMTRRTEVLRIVDQGRRDNHVIWPASSANCALLSLSAQNMKLSRCGGDEELYLRLAIHEIAAVCYIRDDDHHIIAIKFGQLTLRLSEGPKQATSSCFLAVILCDNKVSAKEVCAIISQCFQLIYTDAVLQYLDTNLGDTASMLSTGSPTHSDRSSNATPKLDHDAKSLAFTSQSSYDIGKMSTMSSVASRSVSRALQMDTSGPQLDLSSEAQSLLHQYMNKLSLKLSVDELRRFAQILKMWWNAGLPFDDFCNNLLELYGPERKYLLSGMRPFIPDGDSAYFEKFLSHQGLADVDTITTPSQREMSLENSMVGAVGDSDSFGHSLNGLLSLDHTAPFLQKTT